MIGFEVQDNLTDYFTRLEETVNEHAEEMVREAGMSLAHLVINQGKIWGFDEYGDFGMLYMGDAPYHSGALVESALRPEQQHFRNSQSNSILDLYWTGMYADYSWWEFRHDEDTSKPPEVDYALFQETGSLVGIPHPDSDALKARHKGFFRKTVNDEHIHRKLYDDIGKNYMNFLRE